MGGFEENIMNARMLFLSKGIIKRENVSDEIYYSWMRCKLHNVNSEKFDYRKFITGINMRQSYDKKYSELIENIKRLRIDESNILISDMEGKIIYSKLNFAGLNFNLVNNMNEEVVGTNAIGLSVINKKSMRVTGFEHFNLAFCKLISESFMYENSESGQRLIVALFTEIPKQQHHEDSGEALKCLLYGEEASEVETDVEKVVNKPAGNTEKYVATHTVNRFTAVSNDNEKTKISNGEPSDTRECKLLTLKVIERNAIEKTLEAVQWNMVESAKILGIGRSTLYRKVKEYNLNVPK